MKPLKLTPVLILFLSLLLTNLSYPQTGWVSINDYRSYYYLDGQFVNNNTIYLCGGFNGIAKSTDKGVSWVWKSNIVDTYNGFSDLQFFNEQNGVMCGEYIGVYKTSNAGDTWQKIYSTGDQSYVGSVSFINANTGFLLTKGQTKLLKTTDAGESWNEIYSFSSMTNKIFFINAETGFRNDYMGNNQSSQILKTTDGGASWTYSYSVPFDIKQFEKLNDGSILAMTYSAGLIKSTDFGSTWVTLLDANASAGNLSVINQNNFIVTHYGNKAKYTTDGGLTWSEKDLPANGNIFTNTSGDIIFSAGDFQRGLYKINNNWNQIEDVFKNSIRQNLTDIKIFDYNNFYIFADSNYVIKSTNGGVSLSKENWGASTAAVYFKDMNNGYAAIGKKICRTQNAGASWDTISNLSPYYQGQYFEISNMHFLTDNFAYLTIANSGMQWSSRQILFTTDGGYNWHSSGVSSYSSGSGTYYSSQSIVDFKMTSQSTGYYILAASTSSQFGQTTYSYELRKTSNGGNNWISLNTNINTQKIYHIDFINDNTGYASIDSNRFMKTIDGGATWILKNYLSSSPEQIYMIDEMNIYNVSVEKFYRTRNGGITWEVQNPGINMTSGYNKISFLNSDIGYIIGRDGTILKTTTGGTVLIGNNNSLTADKYFLSQNYPNPFNPETKIQFSIPKNGLVKIVVYDMLGREVKELVNEFKQQGSYNVSFNGASLSSGIYFYKLITDDFVETKKMILVK
ncbi:MAG: T9SS type A sorting domain-containing protein [Bacteroidetes bacterium]|nr:T9SS type A sorting domain-containing protein [Bacteroidota bacterium]